MSSPWHDERWRLLWERLKKMLEHAEQTRDDDELVKLAMMGLALLDRHRVDRRGRCRYCRSGRRLRRKRQCTVVPVVSLYLEQPRQLLL